MATAGWDSGLREILCCPLTRQSLRPAASDELARAGTRTDEPLTEGLVREDGRLLYPVQNGIPRLVPEAGILLTLEKAVGQNEQNQQN